MEPGSDAPTEGEGRKGGLRWRSLILRKGPLLMMAASLLFVVMTGCVKGLREVLSGPEVVFWRGALSVPVLFFLARRQGIALRNRKVFAARLVLGYLSLLALAIATKGLSLVDVNLVTKLRPVLIALFAPLLLGKGELPGGRTWMALGLGFAGCAVLLVPELALGSVYGLWALLSVTCSALSHTALRRLGATDGAATIVFWFHVGLAVGGAANTLATGGTLLPPSLDLWPLLLGMTAAATAGQLLLTRAYALDRAPVVAAAAYVGPLWALLGDLFVFRLLPPWNALVGGAMVLASSLWILLSKARGVETEKPAG